MPAVSASTLGHLEDDPPRFFMKILDRGEFVIENEQAFVKNSRLPDAVALDLRAQIGAINVARTRLDNLLEERGEELVADVMSRSIDLAERQVRNFISQLPDGEWGGEAFMDGVRVGDERICRVALKLSCENDFLCFDYAGSSDQVDAAVNSTLSARCRFRSAAIASSAKATLMERRPETMYRCCGARRSVVNATYSTQYFYC